MSHEPPPLHVVAAVLRDVRGRILLARRNGQRELAGLWEFPGGKVEPGESAGAALTRELHEELGIRLAADESQPLICVAHRMPSGKRIRLDIYEVSCFRGRARGMEAQAITWVKPEQLGNYSMPEADIPAVAALTQPATYVDVDVGVHESTLARVLDAPRPLHGRGGVRLRLVLTGACQTRIAALEGVSAWARQHAVDALLDTEVLGFETTSKLAQRFGFGLHLSEADLSQLSDDGLDRARVCAADCSGAPSLQRAQQLGLDFVRLAIADSDWVQVEALREAVRLPFYLPSKDAASLALARRHGVQGWNVPLTACLAAQ
ncbi:MAG TPA: NUDIX domain-containing protein [Chiayiivirga sp.]|nr:NUDIX domain-containing protein [Chiayiivirga sp.]